MLTSWVNPVWLSGSIYHTGSARVSAWVSQGDCALELWHSLEATVLSDVLCSWNSLFFLPNEAHTKMLGSFILSHPSHPIYYTTIPWKPFQLPFIFWGWVSTTSVGPHSVSLLRMIWTLSTIGQCIMHSVNLCNIWMYEYVYTVYHCNICSRAYHKHS